MHQIPLEEAIRLVRGNATIFSNTTVNMLEYMAQFHTITLHETPIFERDFDVQGIHIMPIGSSQNGCFSANAPKIRAC